MQQGRQGAVRTRAAGRDFVHHSGSGKAARMPRLRPLALACLLACGAPSAYAANCDASNQNSLTGCFLGANSGDTITLTTAVSAPGVGLTLGSGSLTFISNGGGLALDSLNGNGGATLTFDSAVNGTLNTSSRLLAGGTLNLLAAGGATLTVSGGSVQGGGTLVLGDGTHAGTVDVQSAITTMSSVQVNGGSAIFEAANSYSGTTTIGNGLRLTLSGNGTLGTGDVTDNGQLHISKSTNSTIANNISGSGTLVTDGTGTLTLSGANTYTGGTTVSQGTLEVASDGALGTGSVNLAGGNLRSTGPVTLANDINFATTTGTVSASAGNTLTLTGGLTTANNAVLTFGSSTDTGSVFIGNSSMLVGSGVTVHVAGGQLTGNAALGTLTGSATSTTVDSGATLNFGGHAAAVRNLQGAGTLKNDGTNTVVQSGNFSGQYTGSGNLQKTTAGTLVLSGANDYTGTTTVAAGTLQVGDGGATGQLGSGNVIISVGATLLYNRNNTALVDNVIAGSTGSNLNQSGTGTTVLTGDSSFNGSVNVQAGTLQLGNGGTTGGLGTSATYNVAAGGTLAVNRSNAIQLDNQITGAGKLKMAGSGTLTLTNGTSNYSGGTDITAGTIEVATGGTLGTGDINMLGGSLRATDTLTLTNVVNFSGTTGAVSAAAGKVLHLANAITTQANTTATFGASGDTGTISLDGFGTIDQASHVRIAGGTLTGNATLGSLGDAASMTVDSGATLDIAGRAITIRNLQGAGTVKNDAVEFFISSGNFSGNLTGTLSLGKDTTGTLALSGANNYSGTTKIFEGTVEVGGTAGTLGSGDVEIRSAGTLAYNRSNDFTLANTITGTGTLNKLGTGKMSYSGNGAAYTGTTNVNAGTLSVNSSLGGTMNVNGGGTLGGSGTVGGVTVFSGGVLAPGNSIGTLTVNGNLTFNAGSTYRVETDTAGNSDKTVVNGNLAIAGTLDIQAGSGAYARNTSYTILTNTGTQSGSFNPVTTNLAFLTPTVVYNSNSVVLNMRRNDVSYSSVGGSPNERAVGSYLDGLGSTTGALGILIGQIDNLSAGGARTAFDGLSGSTHAAASQVALGMGSAFGQGLMGHLGNGSAGAGAGSGATGMLDGGNSLTGTLPWGLAVDAPMQMAGMFGAPGAGDAGYGFGNVGASNGGAGSGTLRGGGRETGAAASGDSGSVWGLNPNAAGGLWGQALGGGGRIASDGNGPGSSYRSGGFLAGADFALTSSWLVGAAGGYQRANWDASTNGTAPASGKVETPMGAVYARYSSGPWMIAATGSYADNKFTTNRSAVIGTTTYSPTSTHHGGEWGAGVQAELALAAGAWEVRPLAGLRYARLKEDAFTESGGNVANLAVDARVSSNTTLSGGLKGVRRFGSTGDEGAFEVRVIASHLYGDNDAPVSARLAGQSASFVAAGTPLKRDAVTFGAGFSRRVGSRLYAYADFSYEDRGSGQNAYALSAGLRYRW